MRAWLTPNSLPSGEKCIRLIVPDGYEWEAAIRGALVPLFDTVSWEKFGDVTPEDAASVMFSYGLQWLRWEECLSVGTILYTAGANKPDFALWADGSEVSQAEYPLLYSILGTTWGSAGAGNFKLPDLRGRVPLGTGQGSGLSEYALGDTGGEESVALQLDEMPEHDHEIQYTLDVAQEGVGVPYFALNGLLTYDTTSKGSGEPHENRPPYAALNAYIIAR